MHAQGGVLTPFAVSPSVPVGAALGHRKLLLMRLIFPDDETPAASDREGARMIEEASTWFDLHSYHKMTLEGAMSDNLLMPKPSSYYQTNRAFSALMDDALTIATGKGLDATDYDFQALLFKRLFPQHGFAFPGTKMTFLQTTNSAHLIHELGHNLGLLHANAWKTTNGSVIGAGRNEEYGNFFDMMGQGEQRFHTVNAYEKHRLSWLTDPFVKTVTTSGVYRLRPLDSAELMSDGVYAIKVKKDDERDYWIEWHTRSPDHRLGRGVLINWSPWAESNNGTQLLDMTPNSIEESLDSMLLTGRTFSDVDSGVHITVVGPIPRAIEEMELRVNLGSFEENLPPRVEVLTAASPITTDSVLVLSADASDPDGDALAYSWDFYDLTMSLNSRTIHKTWALPGSYQVTCEVSDMKGKTTLSQPVTVRVLTGNDNFANSPALAGARVQVLGSNQLATSESGEPTHGPSAGSSSVWWNWTAPISAETTISTAGSDFRAILGVYVGTSLTNLVAVSRIQRDAADSTIGAIRFLATAGGAYHIAVDGINNSAGTVILTLDQWIDSLVVTGAMTRERAFELGLFGPPGQYQVETSPDLKGWQRLGEVTIAGPPARFVDDPTAERSRAFYRAVRLP